MTIREAAERLAAKASELQIGSNGLLGTELHNLRTALAEPVQGLEALAKPHLTAICNDWENSPNGAGLSDIVWPYLLSALQSAVEAQRENDAKIAESRSECGEFKHGGRFDCADAIAQAIRGSK